MNIWPFKSKTKELETKLNAVTQELAQIKNASGQFSMTDADAWFDMVHGGSRDSVAISPDSAMRTSAVFSCVRLISSAISCAPVKVYKRSGDLRDRAQGHPMEYLLRLRPNRFMTAATFWSAIMQDKLLQGNGYAHIVRQGDTPVALLPLKAQNVSVYYTWELPRLRESRPDAELNRLWYIATFDDGRQGLIDQKDMLHVPNVGWTGKGGIPTIKAMAGAVGLALSAEKSSAAFFENGMQSQLSITFPQGVDHDAMERFKEHMKERYSGAGNHHKPLILMNDGKASTLSMTAEDAQLLESRKFSVIDICRFFGVHPVMIGENEKTSSFGGGIEQMGRWFNTLTLNDHFTALEQEMEVKLFSSGKHFAEFDESDITRGDTQARADYFKAAIGGTQNAGWMTVNEVRAAEGYSPIDGHDEITKPEPASQPPAQGGDNAAAQPADASAA